MAQGATWTEFFHLARLRALQISVVSLCLPGGSFIPNTSGFCFHYLVAAVRHRGWKAECYDSWQSFILSAMKSGAREINSSTRFKIMDLAIKERQGRGKISKDVGGRAQDWGSFLPWFWCGDRHAPVGKENYFSKVCEPHTSENEVCRSSQLSQAGSCIRLSIMLCAQTFGQHE